MLNTWLSVADLGGDPGVQRNPPFCQDVKNTLLNSSIFHVKIHYHKHRKKTISPCIYCKIHKSFTSLAKLLTRSSSTASSERAYGKPSAVGHCLLAAPRT